MRKMPLVPACLFLCMQLSAFADSKSVLRTLVEAAMANDANRLKAVETLRAVEADAKSERTRRLLDGALTTTLGRDNGIGSADTEGLSYASGISASSLLPAGGKLSLGSSYGYSTENDATTGKEKNDTVGLSASVKIPVFVNGRLVDPRLETASRAATIDLPLEAARETADAQERSTADSVLRLALDAAAADRSSMLAARRAVIAERDAEIARVKRKQGTISYSDLTKTEKDADEARLTALESQFTRDKKLRALRAASGLNENDIDLTVIFAPETSLDPALSRDSVVTQEMRRTAREREMAEMNLVLAGAESSPTLELSTSTTLPGPVARDQKSYDVNNKGTWNATAAVTIPLPFGYGTAHKEAAEARLAAARHGEASAVRASADDLNDLRNAWTTALARVALRQQLFEQAQARLLDVQSSHETQTATKLDVDRAQLTVDDAQAALEDDRSASFKAALDLYAYCGLTPLSLLKEAQQ
jgi:outer membrane protein TolC